MCFESNISSAEERKRNVYAALLGDLRVRNVNANLLKLIVDVIRVVKIWTK